MREIKFRAWLKNTHEMIQIPQQPVQAPQQQELPENDLDEIPF